MRMRCRPSRPRCSWCSTGPVQRIEAGLPLGEPLPPDARGQPLVLGRGAPPVSWTAPAGRAGAARIEDSPPPWRAAAPCARAWRIGCAPELPARMRCRSSRLSTLLILGRAEPLLPNGACGLSGAVSRVQPSPQSCLFSSGRNRPRDDIAIMPLVC